MTGWWFGTWLLFSTSYMGCHPKPIDEVHHVSRWFFNHQPVKNCPIVCWLLRQFTTKHGQMMDGLLLWDYFSGSMGSVTCQNQSPRLRTQATCPCCMKYPQYTIGYIWIYIYIHESLHEYAHYPPWLIIFHHHVLLVYLLEPQFDNKHPDSKNIR